MRLSTRYLAHARGDSGYSVLLRSNIHLRCDGTHVVSQEPLQVIAFANGTTPKFLA
jgi:hypothetical protein